MSMVKRRNLHGLRVSFVSLILNTLVSKLKIVGPKFILILQFGCLRFGSVCKYVCICFEIDKIVNKTIFDKTD
jgi:hypothetical protein